MVYKRKTPLVNGQVYHVFNKSISRFKIFKHETDFSRIVATIRYYQREKPPVKFSGFARLKRSDKNFSGTTVSCNRSKLVEIIAYCIMPTHLHLILTQLKDTGITILMRNILNSYARYFNIKHKRKGPLWEGRFKNVLVKTDEQLLHLTRYIHLNPVTASLVSKPEDWLASSYREYIGEVEDSDRICKYADILKIEPNSYRDFVLDGISYQRELAKIKALLID
ncbi:MAG: transposase [Candidatus Tritonobacter lacicola]|nr:transposase [Candidatus Tritonobacter lacicola]